MDVEYFKYICLNKGRGLMMNILVQFGWFIGVFLLIYFAEVFIFNRNSLKDNKYSIEVKYLVSKFNLDVKKISAKKILHLASLVAAVDVSIVYIILTNLVNNLYIGIIAAILLLIPLIIISYNILGSILTKKYCQK